MPKITYPNKSIGDLFRATEANEIKTKFNALVDNVGGKLTEGAADDLYLRLDGAAPMASNLNMNGHSLLNVDELNGLSVSDLLTQTAGDDRYGRLSAANTWTDNNKFSQPIRYEGSAGLGDSGSGFSLFNTSGTVDRRLWRIATSNSNNFTLRLRNDTGGDVGTVFNIPDTLNQISWFLNHNFGNNNITNVNQINGTDADDLLTETVGDDRYLRLDGANAMEADLDMDGNSIEDCGDITGSGTRRSEIRQNFGLNTFRTVNDEVIEGNALRIEGSGEIVLRRLIDGSVTHSLRFENTRYIFMHQDVEVREDLQVDGQTTLHNTLDLNGHDILDTGSILPETADTDDIGSEALPYRKVFANNIITSFETDVTFTVGLGGDFDTLSEALYDASKLYPLFINEGVKVTINLLSGYEQENQVIIRGLDLRFVTITSVDATVPVKRNEITTAVNVLGTNFYPTIYGENAFMPTIDCLFVMDTSGTADQQMGIYLWNSTIFIKEDAGMTDTAWDNLHVRDGYVSGNRSIFSNAGRRCIELIDSRMGFADGVAKNGGVNALSIRAASNMFARRADLSDTPGIWTVDIREASTIELRDADLSNSGTHCIRNEGAAYIHAQRADLTNSAGLVLFNNPPSTSTGGAGGGVVNLTNADGTGSGSSPNITMDSGVIVQGHEGTNLVPDISVNTLDSKGIFFE